MADASAVIVTYFTGPALWDCLAAARADPMIRERIIVDNGNPEDVSTKLRALAQEGAITLIEGQGNVGFAAGSNRGAARATDEFVLFLNPDATLAPNAVSQLIETASQAKHSALVGGRLTNAEGREQRGARRDRLTLWRAFVSFSGLSALERLSPLFRDMHRERDPLPASAIEIGAVSGALMLMRREDFQTIGGFDEAYFLHVEDIDLCRRVEEAGGQVLFEPRAEAIHARSTSAAPRGVIERHKARGFARYFRKFARNPIERAFAAFLGAALTVILPLRAALSRH